MHGKGGRTLYVGRAKNIRYRLTSHVREYEGAESAFSLLDEADSPEEYQMAIYLIETTPPIDLFLKKVERVKIVEMSYEKAKKREETLVKKLNPPFNKRFSDGYNSDDYNKLRDEIREIKRKEVTPIREKRLREAFGEL